MKFNSPKSQIMNINWNIAKLNEELSLRIKRWMEELEDYFFFFGDKDIAKFKIWLSR